MNKHRFKVGDWVMYGACRYKVAEVKNFPHGEMIGIYDEPPSKHVDYINSQNLLPANRRKAGAKLVSLSLVTLSLLCSCQVISHESHASATKWEKDFGITWGGTTHTTGADGWDNATDHNASFQVAAQTAGVALGSWIAYLQQHSKDITDQLANANLTSFQKAQLNQQLALTQAQLKSATDQALIQAGHFKTP